MEIKSLNGIDFDIVFDAFAQAFADYEIQQSKISLQAMLKRRGFNADLSFAAFEGNKIVAFTLNGIGKFNGINTAYDTGTGTLKEYRGKGLATKIFEYSLPYLKKAGIEQYLLEVLQYNTKAISVYKNLGFEVTREFDYFILSNQDYKSNMKVSDFNCSIKQVNLEDLNFVSEFWDFNPSWQNSFESIKRSKADFVILSAYIDTEIVGYCVFEPISGDVTQIAVDKENRRKGVATALLNEAIKLNKKDKFKFVNIETTCHSFIGFLEAQNNYVKGAQYEMIKLINS